MTSNLSLHINPFAFSTAQAVWNQAVTPLHTKVINTALAAAKDVLIENPYKMTIGNSQKLFAGAASLTLKSRVLGAATVAFSSLYTFMLYGALINFQGRLLLTAGTRLSFPALVKIGEGVKQIGKNLFLTGAVPVYAVAYALPKKIIQITPKVLKFAVEKFAQGVEWVIKKAQTISGWAMDHIFKPIWNKAILPAIRVLVRVFNYVGAKINRALNAIAHLVETAVKKLFNNFLKPFWNRVIVPLAKLIEKALDFGARKIADAVVWTLRKTETVVKWVFNNVLTPFWNQVIVPVAKTVGEGFKFVATKALEGLEALAKGVSTAANWVIDNLLVPAWENLLNPLLQMTGRVLSSLLNMTGSALKSLFNVVSNVATAVFNHVIAPLFKAGWNLLNATGNFIGTYVVAPLGQLLSVTAQKVGALFYALFESVIKPVGVLLGEGIQMIGSSLNDLKNELVQTVTSVWGRFAGNNV